MKVRLAAVVLSAALANPYASNAQEGLAKVKTIVVIYAENRSFDHLYGLFPGANGIANASSEQKTQLDHDGTVLPYLTIFGSDGKPDSRFPRMPNEPYRIDAAPINVPLNKIALNPVHAFYHNQEQINGAKNNMFAAMSNVGGWTMGYFNGRPLRLWDWAAHYTLADNFFMGAFGGSFLNHFWLVCACTPRFPEAPESMRVHLDAAGKVTKISNSPSARDGAVETLSDVLGVVSPDGYAVNTTQPPYQPSGIPPDPQGSLDLANRNGTSARGLPLPPQNAKTIGDTLSAKNVTWAWYAGGWNEALYDGRQAPEQKRKIIYTREGESPYFVPHHQPFNYFARFAPGTPERAGHLKDSEDFERDLKEGTLPQVSFYKPVGRLTQHPGFSDVVSGDLHIADLLRRMRQSPQWDGMAVIVTYDENGGFWDHVPPPSGDGWGDRWGPGTRIPTIIISPFAKRDYIDSTAYDTTSIIKFITRRFGLEPLPGVRPNVGDLTAAFDWSRKN